MGRHVFAASHLGIFCLPMFHKKDARLLWVNLWVSKLGGCFLQVGIQNTLYKAVMRRTESLCTLPGHKPQTEGYVLGNYTALMAAATSPGEAKNMR